MGKICVECEDPSWTGQTPIVAPELPTDGGVKVVDELPEKGQKGMAYVLVDDLENPTSSQGIFVYDEGWLLTAQPVSEAVQKVDELPDEGQVGVLYYVPKTGDDTYDLYRWIDNGWIKVDTDVKLYGSTGQNTDGAMNQKAVTDALEAIKTVTLWIDTPLDEVGSGTLSLSRYSETVDYVTAEELLALARTSSVILKHVLSNKIYSVLSVTKDDSNRIHFSAVDEYRVYDAVAYNLTDDYFSVYYVTVDSIPTIVQTAGTSTAAVMSQRATTSMIYADPSTQYKVKIGNGARASGTKGVAVGASSTASGNNGIAVGASSTASGNLGVALGSQASATHNGSVAIGQGSTTSAIGEVSFGGTANTFTYNSSGYRLLTNVYDPQSDHDAATKGYVDGLVGDIESALNTINNGGNA